jgi:hypothetical protein
MNASELIDNRIGELADWRGRKLSQLRKLILKATPDLVEEWKWDTPVWSNNGNVLAIGAFQDHIKINFFKGAMLDDPHHLFNAGLEARATRAIDIFEQDQVNEAALQELVRTAVALNNPKLKLSKTTPKKKVALKKISSR